MDMRAVLDAPCNESQNDMRKRSKYRPRAVALDPMAFVLERMAPVEQHSEYLLNLKIKNSLAMQSLLRGRATMVDMDALIAMSNIAECLQRLGFGSEHAEITVNGREAILRIGHRAVTHGRYVPTGPEITALNALMELHDAQMSVITVADMDKALALGRNLIRSGAAATLPSIKELAA